MDICLMSLEEYDEVSDLWVHTPGMGLNSRDDSREGIARYLERNPATCFVAKADGKTVGVILSGHDGRRGFIYHLAVKAGERKKGVARKLVNAALNALQAEGISKAACVVFADNEAGNAFWEKMGFGKRDDLVYRNKVLTDTF